MPSKTDQDRVAQAVRLAQLKQAQLEPGMVLMVRELDYRMDKIKARLLECPLEDFHHLQGQAKAYSSLLKDVRNTEV